MILSEEKRMLVETARGVAQEHFAPTSQKWDQTSTVPLHHADILLKHGLLGITVPQDYGGAGADTLDLVLLVEQVSRVCPNTAMLLSCGDGAPCRAIAHLGSEKQKRRYLPGFVNNTWRAAWAMSEPDAGSDIGGMKTRAVLKGDRYILNGAKVWCSLAQAANLFLVFARLSDAPGIKGVGALLLEAPAQGFSVGKHLELIGLRGSGMAELFFDNVEIPAENLLVPAGEMRRLLGVLNFDRVATNPPICLGAADAAFDAAARHLNVRKQYGKKLADFQGLQWRLADMAIDLAAARALIYQAAADLDAGGAGATEASIAKTYANEMSVRVTNMAMQLMGASGLSRELKIEQMFRDVRGFSVGYGTAEVQRNLIARAILSERE